MRRNTVDGRNPMSKVDMKISTIFAIPFHISRYIYIYIYIYLCIYIYIVCICRSINRFWPDFFHQEYSKIHSGGSGMMQRYVHKFSGNPSLVDPKLPLTTNKGLMQGVMINLTSSFI